MITLSTITPTYTASVPLYDSRSKYTYSIDDASASCIPYTRPPRAEWLETTGTKFEEHFKVFKQKHGQGYIQHRGAC